tara:strand:+ start:4287 stop:4481 length:195 start_codon:yes stop_codon:yes gene_type:complete
VDNKEIDIRIAVLETMHKDLHDQCEKNPTAELKKRKLEVKTELQKLQTKKDYDYDEHAGGIETF